MDSAQYAWRRFVLGYDNDTQHDFLEDIFGELTFQKAALIVAALFGIIITIWVLILGLGRRRSHESIEHQLYRKFCNYLEKKGIKREASQAPEDFSQLAIAHLPGLAREINAFTQTYSALCYNPSEQGDQHEKINKLKAVLKTIK